MAMSLRLRKHQLPAQRPNQGAPGVHILADYVFGEPLSGIFLFESGGMLSGLEVYALAGDAPAELPEPHALRPLASMVPTA